MTIFRDISVMWSLFHVLVLFIMLYESRFSRKTTIIATGGIMGFLFVLQCVFLFLFGPQKMTQIIVLTATLPSLLFFWIMSKNRNGIFFFTFCLCDTLAAEVLMITNLLDHFVFGGTYIFMFVVRLLAFPLIELLFYRFIRPLFHEVQRSVCKGWSSFAIVSAIYYLTLVVISSFPDEMVNRPREIPAIILVMTLMPLTYWIIFQTLRRQQKIYELAEQDNLLKLQVQHMQSRIEQFSDADEKFRIERHDMRHKLRTMEEMLQKGNLEELRSYVATAEQKLEETVLKHYTANPVLDAVLTAYLGHAETLGIRVQTDLAIPAEPKVDVTELSMVFANAIENAVSACEKLPRELRRIDIRARMHPQFMFQITNPYVGTVTPDENGIPRGSGEGHGFGTRSIIAFCEKYGAFYEFKTEGGTFALRIVMGNAE